MTDRIDMILLDTNERMIDWSLGDVYTCAPSPIAVQTLIERHVLSSEAIACLFWNPVLGHPQPETIEHILTLPGHVWHAGLALGTGGLPGLIDFAAPTWMLNRDPDPRIEATSWRVSLHACLILTEVLRQLGGLDDTFCSLDGAALEMGYRYVKSGAIVRHIPRLIPPTANTVIPQNPLIDEFRFIRCCFNSQQFHWMLVRSLLTCQGSLGSIARAAKLASTDRTQLPHLSFRAKQRVIDQLDPVTDPKVSVLIPTLDRYRYLRLLLGQLRNQTVRPFEVIVVDQTEERFRNMSLIEDFADLPLRVIYRDQPGQCSSRNVGLMASRGDYVILLDDDVEIGPNVIESLLETVHKNRAGAGSGTVFEPGEGFKNTENSTRTSDVFPAGISIVSRAALISAGLFDLAYERGQRADGDLGMRLYLTGQLLLLNSNISVLHHHAPRGGLRAHKARVITYASSRRRVLHRHLPSTSEIYYAKRYFSPRQVRESLWLRVFGTLVVRGGLLKRLAKLVIGLVLLPDTCLRIRQRTIEADHLLKQYPQIPSLE